LREDKIPKIKALNEIPEAMDFFQFIVKDLMAIFELMIICMHSNDKRFWLCSHVLGGEIQQASLEKEATT
jgi:hypothetical protein